MEPGQRVAIVFDGTYWFLRGIRAFGHVQAERQEMIERAVLAARKRVMKPEKKK